MCLQASNLAPKIDRRRPAAGRVIVVLFAQNMPFLVKLNLEFSGSLLKEAKATLALSLFSLDAAKKRAIIVSFRWDSSVLTAARTAGVAAVCKDVYTRGNCSGSGTF